MRVLIPTHPGTNTGHPRLKGRGGGGLETAMEKMIDVLVEDGHEVTLLTPDDYPIENPKILQCSPGFKSKKEAGRASWKVWTEAWLSVADQYDRVLLNDALLTTTEETAGRLREISPKMRMIYHLYDNQIDGAFMAKQIQIFAEVKRHGGRVACVSPTLPDYLKKQYPDGKLGKNPYYVDHLTKDVSDLQFEEFRVSVALETDEIKDSGGDFIFIGRGVKEKNLKLALQAFEKAETGDRKFHVFTTEPNGESSREYWEECLKKYLLGRNVVAHVEAPRGDLIDCLSRSSVLVFPSVKEACALVPIEGASYGLSIIHKDLNSRCYTEADVHLPRVTVRSLADAMEKVGVPTLEEKRDRAAKTQDEFSAKRFLGNLLRLLE